MQFRSSPPTRDRIRVFITSREVSEGAWRGHAHHLKRLYELSDKRYELIEDSETADIVLVGNVREQNWGIKILRIR